MEFEVVVKQFSLNLVTGGKMGFDSNGLTNSRIYLSPPNISAMDIAEVVKSFESGWVAPVGPDIDSFENEVASFVGRKFAVALSSGTGALHLAYKAAGIKPGDEVVIPTMTFGATAFPISYIGARPVFIDVEPNTWTVDVGLMAEFLKKRAAINRLPAAVVAVDLYGVTCDYKNLIDVTSEYGIPIIADSAEALGATYLNENAGKYGDSAVLSFNGNKIITTSGGGMFLTDSKEVAGQVRYWATQSREPTPWYEHLDIGYNYRLSNILASLGRSQLNRIHNIVSHKREIRAQYSKLLTDVDGINVMGDPSWGKSNAWLTTICMDTKIHPDGPKRVRIALERQNIESRPVWKPMHQQPIYRNEETFLTGASDSIFSQGLCLPSGISLGSGDIQRVVKILIEELNS